ncbi:TonB-dependent receptor domain-containing protein [Sphingobium fuliginis]|uniref:TonB-dependent receptor n=1 Tax=Sphingobium fuliginis (strain ATCC 27551) TaxID=336203 RepID=A0A292ZBS5_SPHSA|nr:TonB-dependent receptor [Sphingobium fuliginis]GAY20396.1 TonB-dependent receptor [Sphingobium fuliginis]
MINRNAILASSGIRLMSSASFAALIAVASPTTAFAQVSPVGETANADSQAAPTTDSRNPPATAESDGAAADVITVTGTRVVRDGYKAPTPTSVIGAEEIANKAATNIADFVNVLPSLSGSTSPRANVGSVSAGQVGINALNLRNLGANRTLILLDGQRVAASTLSGLVDINTIPQALVKRVDIVTGGASAGYGSDAVAGVVNFILDKEFTGLKGQVQGGVTTYGDDRNYNLSLTAGTRFADGRGHLLLSGEIAHNDGIAGIGERDWYNYAKLFINPAYNATTNNTVPQLLALPNAGFATATPGGIITSGPLRGTYFGPGGTPTQFNYGPIVSGNIMQGGDYRYADFGTSGDLDPRTSRQSIFGRLSYDVSDHVQLFAQGSYSRATTHEIALKQFNLGNITIQPDNAFIPASIAPRVTGTFTLGTFNEDIGGQIATTRRSSVRAIVGAQGDFDAIGTNWNWDVSAQRSVNRIYTDFRTTVTSRYNAAIDSVRVNGVIQCRTLATNPGCVPYNVFGTGVNSQAALDYVLGTSWGRTTLTQNVFAANLRGEPFSTWAGPVSIATGVEHRREGVTGSNDPLTTATARPYFAGNFFASTGHYNVTEGYLEAVVPLAKDAPFAKSLDLNGAVRATDYSTSGYVTTWKVGLTYSPVSDVTFRVTRSRDIRAPNLAELFQAGQTATTSLVDPFRNNASSTVSQITSGNLGLTPEKADNFGAGVVFTPQFLPGFAASVDYYDIGIEDAIVTLNAASVVTLCQQGNSAYCAQITRLASGPLVNNLTAISSVAVVPVNVARQKSRGLDFEASYRAQLFGGTVSLRGLATRFLENYSNDGITPATDTVGTNGTNGTLRNSLPKWRYLATVGFDHDPIAVSLTARGFSAGVYNTSYVECSSACPVSTPANMTINNNQLPGATYFDANVTLKLPQDIQLFLSVDNIANKDPARMAFGTSIGAAPLSVNSLLYDVLGRTFRLGLRFKM